MKKLFFLLFLMVAVLAIPKLGLATTENTCDLNGDDARDLTDVALFSQCATTFDANNDGLHDLTDEALFTSNNQNQAWCDLYMTECMYMTIDPIRHLTIVDTRITNILNSYPIVSTARVYWRSSIGSSGEYRYSKDMLAIRNLPWRTDGVSNDPSVTGNMFASQVDLTNLDDNATYYVDVRKYLGTQYGNTQSLSFTTGDGNYPGFNMSLDRTSYTIKDTAILTLRSHNLGAPYNVDLYGKFNPVGEDSKTFLIRSNITIGLEEDIPVDLDGFVKNGDKEYEYSLLICSSYDGCIMGSTNSIMINIETDDNDDLPVIVKGVYYDPSDVDSLLLNLKQNRDITEEARLKKLVSDSGKKFSVSISDNFQNQAAAFVAYGIDNSTIKFGSGERKAILDDYLDTTGYADIKWDDISRLANGTKPVGRNLAKEQAQVARALKTFEAVYGHKPNFKDVKEDLFWNTLMYRIRFERDLVKEKVGIVKFQEIFGKTPTTPYDWSVVRALGYIK